MKHKYASPLRRISYGLALSFLAMGVGARAQNVEPDLQTRIRDLDRKVFDAYNTCDMETFQGYFTPTVEFYHDKGGATFDRATVVGNTKKYICGNVTRKVVPGTFEVYPIKDYGAIEEGEHVFCQIENGKCEGAAKFLMVWENDNEDWKITRVMSYGHRALSEKEMEAFSGDETTSNQQD